jgi:hypothetical protein
MKLLKIIGFLSLIFLSGFAHALEAPARELTSERIKEAREVLMGVLLEENGVLARLPSRIRMSRGYMKIGIYTWPPLDGRNIFHALVKIFAEYEKQFSVNLCEVTNKHPEALIGTVYVEYYTLLEYTKGKDPVARLEFQESTECRPGLEAYFQRVLKPRKS